jgi:mannose-6-phosphate isomerase-like protein (cupin superfamily)
MADVTVKRVDELENRGGRFFMAGKGLGVTAWGMNVEKFPANFDEYPEHEHSKDGQEEVYVVLEGTAMLRADGESFELQPGTLARVGAGQKRKLVPGGEGVTLLAIGGIPGKAWEPRS